MQVGSLGTVAFTGRYEGLPKSGDRRKGTAAHHGRPMAKRRMDLLDLDADLCHCLSATSV